MKRRMVMVIYDLLQIDSRSSSGRSTDTGTGLLLPWFDSDLESDLTTRTYALESVFDFLNLSVFKSTINTSSTISVFFLTNKVLSSNKKVKNRFISCYYSAPNMLLIVDFLFPTVIPKFWNSQISVSCSGRANIWLWYWCHILCYNCHWGIPFWCCVAIPEMNQSMNL